jgi:hypothetical protein
MIKSIEQNKRLIKAFADPCDGVIYHYTSGDGLKGIVENSEMWLTNTAFVNDITECKALQEEKNLFNDNDFSNTYVADSWRNFIQYPDGRDNNTYIASFSKGEESLGQWRAYGNFRIGFRAKDLVKSPFNLYKCVYEKDEIKKWILKKEKVKEWGGDGLDDQVKRGTSDVLIRAASKKYKNKHFKEENEIRLAVISDHTWERFPNSPSIYENDPPIHYRNHPAFKMPVPYVKFFIGDKIQQVKGAKGDKKETAIDMKKRKLKEEKETIKALLPITEIFVGPMPHQKEAELACKILLKDNGYENVKVDVSKMPYRGF